MDKKVFDGVLRLVKLGIVNEHMEEYLRACNYYRSAADLLISKRKHYDWAGELVDKAKSCYKNWQDQGNREDQPFMGEDIYYTRKFLDDISLLSNGAIEEIENSLNLATQKYGKTMSEEQFSKVLESMRLALFNQKFTEEIYKDGKPNESYITLEFLFAAQKAFEFGSREWTSELAQMADLAWAKWVPDRVDTAKSHSNLKVQITKLKEQLGEQS